MRKLILPQPSKNGSSRYNRLLFLFFSFFLSVGAIAQDRYTAAGLAEPTVTSDRDSYAPGEVAHLTGSGWKLDQLVHVEFKEEPDYADFKIYDVNVDSRGNWRIDYQVEQRHLGVGFTVTAVGKTTAYKAKTIFTTVIHSLKMTSPTETKPLKIPTTASPKLITIDFQFIATNKNKDIAVSIIVAPAGVFVRKDTIRANSFEANTLTKGSVTIGLPYGIAPRGYIVRVTLTQENTNSIDNTPTIVGFSELNALIIYTHQQQHLAVVNLSATEAAAI